MLFWRWNRRASSVFLLILTLAVPLRAASYSKVTLDRTEQRRLRSEAAGQEYQVLIRYPEGYEKSEKRYPVIYVLDGDLMFSIAHGVVQLLEWGGEVPDLIAVGVRASTASAAGTLDRIVAALDRRSAAPRAAVPV